LAWPLKEYFQTLNTILGQFRDNDFVESDSLEIERFYDSIVHSGEIALQGRLVLTVVENFSLATGVDDSIVIVPDRYSYNLTLRGHNNVFRFDNSHPEFIHPGLSSEHQKHLFDWRTGRELPDSPVSSQGHPAIHDVLCDAREWHGNHFGEIPHPHEFVPQSQLRDSIQTW